MTEYATFVAGVTDGLRRARTPKQLDTPLRIFLEKKKLFNGVGAYTATEFLDYWRHLFGHNAAAPVSVLLVDDLVIPFCRLLHEFMWRRRCWLDRKYVVHEFASGARPCIWWEREFKRR